MKKLGLVIRTFRELRGEKQESMAIRLGYKNHSTYAKLERGELTSVNIHDLLKICEILRLSLFLLLNLSDVNVLLHKNSILSWNEFYKSLENNSDDEIKTLMTLISQPNNAD